MSDILRQPLDPGTLVLIIMRLLGRQGWRRGPMPAFHTETSEKTFGRDRFVQRKAYLQCLVVLDQLRQRGLAELSSSQPIGYYRLRLHSKLPGDVPICQKSDDYFAILNGHIARGSAEHVAIETIVAQASDAEEEQGFQISFDDRVSEAEPRTPNAGSPGENIPLADIGHGSAIQLQQVFQVPAVDSGGIVINAVQPGQYAVVLPNVRYEEHMLPGQCGHYRRLIVMCPLAECRHREAGQSGCQKKRNIGHRQTMMLGSREPEAFLGAWAAAASQFDTRSAHVRWQPPVSAVREFMARHGWL